MLKHLTIILAFLTTIGTQVCAADSYKVGDVFYCNETAVAFSNHETGWKVANGELKAFRFRLIKDTSGEMLMKFGSSGYFANATMNVAEGTEPPPLNWSVPIVRKTEKRRWELRDRSLKRLLLS